MQSGVTKTVMTYLRSCYGFFHYLIVAPFEKQFIGLIVHQLSIAIDGCNIVIVAIKIRIAIKNNNEERRHLAMQ